MNEKLKNELLAKGWNEKEVKETEEILKKSKIKKSRKIISLDKYVYWIALFVGIIGNLIISIALVPFLLVLKGFQLYFVVIILGISFGLFFEILIRDIENLGKKHHLIAGIVIPCLALINMYIITAFAGEAEAMLKIGSIAHIPALIGLVYAMSFIAPYALYQITLRNS